MALPLCFSTPATRHAVLNGSWPYAHSSSTAPQPYYNLSCPFEWSKYSCVHQGASHASLAARVRFRALDCALADSVDGAMLSRLLHKRRLVFIGDSLLRQVYISLGCLAGAGIRTHETEWAPCERPWPCHETHACVQCGEHSGFLRSRMLLHNGGKVVFMDALSVLEPSPPPVPASSSDERGGVDHRGIDVDDQDWSTLSMSDVVVMQAGIHGQAHTTFRTATTIWRAVQSAALHSDDDAASNRSARRRRGHDLPTLIYVTTPQEHFASSAAAADDDSVGVGDGAYDPARLAAAQARAGGGSVLGCAPRVRPTRAEAEWQYLRQLRFASRSMLDALHGVVSLEGLEALGNLKIGSGAGAHGDCAHFCMPGVPDVLALAVYTMLLSLPRVLTAGEAPLDSSPRLLPGWPARGKVAHDMGEDL